MDGLGWGMWSKWSQSQDEASPDLGQTAFSTIAPESDDWLRASSTKKGASLTENTIGVAALETADDYQHPKFAQVEKRLHIGAIATFYSRLGSIARLRCRSAEAPEQTCVGRALLCLEVRGAGATMAHSPNFATRCNLKPFSAQSLAPGVPHERS